MQNQMTAIGIRKFGGLEVLESLTLPIPTVTPGTVLIRVVAAGVNPADWRLRDGQFRLFVRKFPFIPGSDLAGVVESVGEGVTSFKKGDAVYAMSPLMKGGGYAEYALIPASAVALIPDNVTFAEAAAVPLTGLTALEALTKQAVVKPGDPVLIYGASGGVGTFAVQIAKALGAHVIGVASGANADLVRSLGADEFLDYKTDAVLSGSKRYPIIFDAVNGHSASQWRSALTKNGLLVSVNPVAGNPVASLMGRVQGYKVKGFLVKPDGAALATLSQYLSTGQVRVIIDHVYRLAQAAEAQQYSEAGRTRGKLVLIVDSDLAQTAIMQFKRAQIV